MHCHINCSDQEFILAHTHSKNAKLHNSNPPSKMMCYMSVIVSYILYHVIIVIMLLLMQ